jgi:kynureninase
VQATQKKHPEFDIKIDSINARGLAPSIRFTVQLEEHKEPALEAVRKEYEGKVKQLESERDRLYQLVARAVDTPKEVKLITAGPGAIVATDGSTINIQQHIHNALELQKAIVAEPEESESFAKVAKKTALDIIGEAMKDIAKGQVKEAAKQIIELGKDLGPLFVKMAPIAYEFFKGMVT